MIAAPRFCTVGRNSTLYHLSISSPGFAFLSASIAAIPLMVQFEMSGYIVGEWLPQMQNFLMFFTLVFAFFASCPSPLSWSNRVIAEKFSSGMSGALLAAIRQFVLQGFPRVTTLQDLRAYWFRALPVAEKIAPFSLRRSPLS